MEQMLKKYIGIFREIRIMTTKLSTWRFAAIWLIGLIVAIAYLCGGVSSLIAAIRG